MPDGFLSWFHDWVAERSPIGAPTCSSAMAETASDFAWRLPHTWRSRKGMVTTCPALSDRPRNRSNSVAVSRTTRPAKLTRRRL